MAIRFSNCPKIHKRTLLHFTRAAAARIGALRRAKEICVIFVSDATLRKMNRQFLRHDYFTDVIAFRYPKQTKADKNDLPFGDIYISLDMARKQARAGGHAWQQELALLTLHGLLHLAGYDDHAPKDKKRMFARQTQLFKTINPKLAPQDVLRNK